MNVVLLGLLFSFQWDLSYSAFIAIPPFLQVEQSYKDLNELLKHLPAGPKHFTSPFHHSSMSSFLHIHNRQNLPGAQEGINDQLQRQKIMLEGSGPPQDWKLRWPSSYLFSCTLLLASNFLEIGTKLLTVMIRICGKKPSHSQWCPCMGGQNGGLSIVM